MSALSTAGSLGILTIAIAACSGTSTGSGPGGSGLQCAKGEVRISGTIGGTQIDQRYVYKGIVLNQVKTPKNATVSFASGGQLAFQWDTLAAVGDSVAARGSVLMPDGPLAGENVCLGSGSTVTLLDDAGQFALKAPTKGTSCPGSATSGELQGCWSQL